MSLPSGQSLLASVARSRIIVTYALLTSVLVMVVRLFESSFIIGQVSEKLYVTVIGLLFLVVGVAVGVKLRRKPVPPMVPAEESRDYEILLASTREADRGPQPGIGLKVGLSPRECEVLLQIALGLSNREIAERLFLSENTIKTHINNIYAKLEVRRRTQAVARAKELGILT